MTGRGSIPRMGSVLIMVVWVITLLSMLAAALGTQSAAALSLTTRLDRQLQAAYLAQAGWQQALDVLAQDIVVEVDGMGEIWANAPGSLQDQPLGDGSFSVVARNPVTRSTRYGWTDEDRFLNLNTAPESALFTLLAVQGGLKEPEAQAVAEAILDWRDEDKDKHDHGAEGFYYLGLSPGYACKDGPFENVEELLLIRGMTLDAYERVAPYVTVFGSGQVNLNTAPGPVLTALGFSPEAVNGIVFYRNGEDNIEGSTDDRQFASTAAVTAELGRVMAADDRHRLEQLIQADLIGVKSDAFRTVVEASVQRDGHSAVRLQGVVDHKGRTLAWAEE